MYFTTKEILELTFSTLIKELIRDNLAKTQVGQRFRFSPHMRKDMVLEKTGEDTYIQVVREK